MKYETDGLGNMCGIIPLCDGEGCTTPLPTMVESALQELGWRVSTRFHVLHESHEQIRQGIADVHIPPKVVPSGGGNIHLCPECVKREDDFLRQHTGEATAPDPESPEPDTQAQSPEPPESSEE